MVISLSDQVKQIPITDVVRRYGFTPNRSGFISCPFHEDKTPSLKLYEENNTWYCFSCCRHGTAIDFVMDLYDLPFKEAVHKLVGDFGISATDRDPVSVRKEIRKREEKKAEERLTEKKWNFFCDALWDRYDSLYSIIEMGGKLLTGSEYAEMEWLGYFLDTYPLGAKISTETKKQILDREWDVHFPILEEFAAKVTEGYPKEGRESETEEFSSSYHDRPEEKDGCAVTLEDDPGSDEDLPDPDDQSLPEIIRSWLKENPANERIGRQCL